MPQCSLAIKDTVTSLWLTSYSTLLENCQFGTPQDAICCDSMSQPEFQGMLDNMNDQAGSLRFIGANPPPR